MGGVGDGGPLLVSLQGNFYKLSKRGGCGGGRRMDQTPIFHFILLIGVRFNFAFFSRLISVSSLMLEAIVFLGIQLWVVEETCITGK